MIGRSQNFCDNVISIISCEFHGEMLVFSCSPFWFFPQNLFGGNACQHCFFGRYRRSIGRAAPKTCLLVAGSYSAVSSPALSVCLLRMHSLSPLSPLTRFVRPWPLVR